MTSGITLWELASIALGGIAFGGPLGWMTYRLYQTGVRFAAEGEAEELLQEARDRHDLQVLEEKETISEIETESWSKAEPEMLATEERIEILEDEVKIRKQKADDRYSRERQQTTQHEQEILAAEQKLANHEKSVSELKKKELGLNQNYVEELAQRLQVSIASVQEEQAQQLIGEAQSRSQRTIEHRIEMTREHSETLGKDIIDNVLARFARAYSGERGIAAVYFELPEQRAILVDPEGLNLKAIEELTGCDVIVEPDSDLVGVAGFDPVRRELTRRILERILKEKHPVNVQFIKDKFEHIKRELFSLIKRDGDNIVKELGLNNVHPEIRQMMGSLRYRYSFTQNQYFHCGEVGWLCGLLASELKTVNIRQARRAGMLHDIGKSMDHAMDGGHAVIGADFIEPRGEAPEIVHAVRAHHFDEQPSTDMAFLVIAADAISGARPGARRSTVESFNQKVTELDSIARSFDGVTDCFVLSGGRELRVLVNGKRIDDHRAMKMSKEMSTRIENECNYPGQIKVVVVREMVIVETTRAH